MDEKINSIPEKDENEQVEATPKKSRAKLYVAAFLVVGLVLVFMLLFLNRNNFKKNGTVSIIQKNSIENATSDNDEANNASRISQYIESQRNSDSSYKYQSHEEVTCPEVAGKKKCFYEENNSVPVNSWTALGHYSSYKSSGDTSELEKSKRDLVTLYDWCKSRVNDCTYLLTQPLTISADYADENMMTFLEKESAALVAQKPATDLMLLSIEARELVLLSKFLKDSSLLVKAKTRLDMAQEEVQKQYLNPFVPKVILPKYTCWVTLAQVEMGIVENDKTAVINALEYLKINDRFQAIGNFENPVHIHPCIETFMVGGKYLENSGYKDNARKLLTDFLTNFYDASDNKILFGEGGTTFYSKSKSTNPSSNMVLISDTAYTNYLIYLNSTL